MLQRDHRGSNSFERIKVLRSRSGKQHWTVIEPLSRAGLEAVDDGNRWRTYIPDEHMLIDQDSLSREKSDLRLRMALAKRNYVFKMEAHPSIAGRPVICIIAAPRCPRLEGRRYCLDEQTAYPLRMETVSPSGAANLVYDTKDVQFPPDMSPGVFEMHPLPGVTTVTYDRPRKLSREDAVRDFGFSPIIPKSLPLGFQVQDMQLSGKANGGGGKRSDWKSVVVWLTDGLVRAGVYQWLPDGKEKRAMADSTAGESHGLQLLIVSDNLGPELRRELLDAFKSGRPER